MCPPVTATLHPRGVPPEARDPRPDLGPSAHTGSPAPFPDACPSERKGPHAYDHLVPALLMHASSRPGDPGHEVRRERLIREFLPLVHNLARRFAGSHSAEDIEQVGVIGLIKAIDRYDPGVAVHGPLAYLVPSVRGEMLRHLRDHTWAMRVPRGIKDVALGANRATVTLTQRLGRPPRPSELADELGVSRAEVIDALGALDSYRATSLDIPDRDTGRPTIELIGADDPAFELVDSRGDVRRLIDELPERERTILLLRFYGEQTQSQIAERIGVSQMHVSRLLSRTLDRLRRQLTTDSPGPGGAGRPATGQRTRHTDVIHRTQRSEASAG